MSDLISRQAAINAIENTECELLPEEWNEITDAIMLVPSAEPERMKGKWIRITQGAMPERYICPFCHRTVETYGVEELLKIRYPYCHCGADMRGEYDD